MLLRFNTCVATLYYVLLRFFLLVERTSDNISRTFEKVGEGWRMSEKVGEGGGGSEGREKLNYRVLEDESKNLPFGKRFETFVYTCLRKDRLKVNHNIE